MPTYQFRNKKSGQILTRDMTISEAEAFSKANPNLEWLCGAPGIHSGLGLGLRKPTEVFRDRLRQINKDFNGDIDVR